jgi:hypothetical protein
MLSAQLMMLAGSKQAGRWVFWTALCALVNQLEQAFEWQLALRFGATKFAAGNQGFVLTFAFSTLQLSAIPLLNVLITSNRFVRD